jgi:phenylalanyl-tRNA synthetase beta chain
MKISYNWLKNYVDFNLTPQDLGEVLTGVGLEVEDVIFFESIKGSLAGVVIGEVVECEKHPDADKLSVTRVNVGTGELLQIVCGAPNVAQGQKVVVAQVGATIYPYSGDKLVMKKAKIRGVESFGMICAEDELGLSDSHAGIMVLDSSVAVGTTAAEYFKVETDYTIEIGLTPNRGDAFSHLGVARDLATVLPVTYRAPVSLTRPDVSAFKVANNNLKIDVEVLDSEACPRYSGVCIAGIKVADSPTWLKNKLSTIGVRSINNVVDITNFVLHEYGQPLHAFDYDKIKDTKVVVKKVANGTKFKTLDEKELTLHAEDLMINDAEKPMCMAGVFGGLDSGVTSSTVNLFIESAYFSSTSIRKTSSRHGLRTDAATHFEKGTDPNITIEALQRAALLITEICGGAIASDVVDIYPTALPDWSLDVSVNRMLRLAGFPIETSTIKTILSGLGIRIEKEEGDVWQLFIPAYKSEVKREADVVEEIVRIYGYNSFTLPKTVKSALTFSPAVNVTQVENSIAELLSGCGLNEVWTNSVSQSRFEENEVLRKQQVKLLNSQTADLDSLRTSMLYSGLEVIAYNQNRKMSDLRFYEFGKTYHKTENAYQEQLHLSLFLTGQTLSESWLGKGDKYNYYHLKQLVNMILTKLGHYHFSQTVLQQSPFDYALVLSNEGIEIARFGLVNRSVLTKFDIKQEVFYADLNWSYLLDKSQFAHVQFTALPKFPAVKRDLALVVNQNISFEQIEQLTQVESKKLLQQIALFDVYKGDKIEAGKKSYAISMTFQHPDKTLTDQEIEKLMSRLMAKFETELGATIRKG